MGFATVILAAGKGSRMKSDMPKVLHPLASAPLLAHVLRCAAEAGAAKTVVVIGHGGEAVQKAALALDETALIVEQASQNGTGHAVLQAKSALAGFEGDVIVLYGDTPFISPDTLDRMLKARTSGQDVIVLGFEAARPDGYGRLKLEGDSLEAIIEHKDASEAERAIRVCNSGVVCADAKNLFALLSEVGDDNASGEIYLTDIIAIARSKGQRCTAILCDEAETMGVNSRADLALAEAAFQRRARIEAMDNGTTLISPETVYFALDTVMGADVLIEPNVFFGPDVSVENGAHIKAFGHFEGCHISEGAVIGPFARLRPGAEIGAFGKVGNFVEIKNAVVGKRAKVNHLSYVGDADIGAESNIGAGVIFCNYDGVFKHHTTLGERVFIGSNSALVSPVNIGDDALIGTGSVVTKDVPAGDLVLARTAQVNKKGRGKRLMDMLRAKKK
ncbi:MAG: bifunctional UDP-N-acetylglucosamine diphosphorylase/glucosamine-1-phosphate N-acetyltransferase GlmU [Rhodobacteraceae bacterium]|nr:bifunctional UDP-N-acetylglucosamine diphosphorylase/glucosamine-1-phosphate N-acetyltransferase GlmU [Paracoccaceae bacterium]